MWPSHWSSMEHVNILVLRYGPDTPRNLLLLKRYGRVEDNSSSDSLKQHEKVIKSYLMFSFGDLSCFSYSGITIWLVYVLLLCGASVKHYGGFWEMFEKYQKHISF